MYIELYICVYRHFYMCTYVNILVYLYIYSYILTYIATCIEPYPFRHLRLPRHAQRHWLATLISMGFRRDEALETELRLFAGEKGDTVRGWKIHHTKT